MSDSVPENEEGHPPIEQQTKDTPKQPKASLQNGIKHNNNNTIHTSHSQPNEKRIIYNKGNMNEIKKEREKQMKLKHALRLEEKNRNKSKLKSNADDSKQEAKQETKQETKQQSIEISFTLDKINSAYQDKTRKIYYKQCPSLKAASGARQIALWKLLSIGRSNNNYPLMSYLIDCYSRDKLHYYISNKSKKQVPSLSILEWSRKYKTVKKLIKKIDNSKDEDLKDIIISGMGTYFARYCAPMILPTSWKINDSISKFVQCISEIGGLILSITKDPIAILPYQIDLVIIPQDVIDINNMNTNTNDDLEQEEEEDSDFDNSDSDSDDSSSDDDDEAPTPGINKQSAAIGDIQQRLKNENIPYQMDIKPNMEREFRNLYRKYTQSVTKSTVKQSVNELKANHSAISMDNLGTDLQRFPHRKRLCIVVDRRRKQNKNDQNDNDEKNEIYLFEPPLFNEMPSNHVREWYVESSYQCIIPGTHKDPITSKAGLNGWINVFSFHIEQADEIRCYFYRNAQMFRFLPKDILNLFQYLFVDNELNHAFINSQEIYRYIQKMNHVWNDVHFNTFRDAFN